MAYPIHGKVCRVSKNSVNIASTKGWNVNVKLDTDDDTSQGDDWKSDIAGCAEWDGGIEVSLDPANTEQKALIDNIVTATPGTVLTDVQFALEDSGDYFSGNIMLTSLGVPTNVSGKVLCSIGFKGQGALSLTIA